MNVPEDGDGVNPSITAEIEHATASEIAAYLHGASRDGIFKRLHKTLRISQADIRWLQILKHLLSAAAFARGYFDAADLTRTHDFLGFLGVQCGRIHNRSARQDPDYWRFHVLAASHKQFIRTIGSWHPRKRTLLEDRASLTRRR